MSIDGVSFTRYANAEKEFCALASATLSLAIREIEVKYDIRISEVRVTMDRVSSYGWSRANCVLVHEQDEAEDCEVPVRTINSFTAASAKPV